jgi:hypothetical protein
MCSVREDEAKEVLFSWARQTIAFAISVRADETGKDLDDPESRRLVALGALDEASDLWQATLRDALSDADYATLMLAYSRKVFSWCDRHINRSSTVN